MSQLSQATLLAQILQNATADGPLTDETDNEARERDLLALAGERACISFLDFVLRPPSQQELGRMSSEEFEYEISHYLQLLGRKNPTGTLQEIAPFLGNAVTRPIAIEVIGTLGLPQAVDALVHLVGAPGLTEEESTRLACALGELDGGVALILLEKLRASTSPKQKRTLDEIKIAIATIEGRAGQR